MQKKIAFISKDGTKLVGIWQLPKETSSKAVILAHGITVDKEEEGMFTVLAGKLAEVGIASFRFDFRGHGESGGKQEEMTIAGEMLDLVAAFNKVLNAGYTRIGIVGSSFGGGITLLTTGRFGKDMRCLCFWNPVLDLEATFIKPFLPWLKNNIGRMKKELKTKGWTYLPVDQPYKIGKELIKEMEKYKPYENIKEISIPVVIIHGDNDTYVPYRDSVKYLSGFTGWHKLVTIKGSDHGFSGDSGDEYKRIAYLETLKFFRKFL